MKLKLTVIIFVDKQISKKSCRGTYDINSTEKINQKIKQENFILATSGFCDIAT